MKVIEFKDVSFSYAINQHNNNNYALDNINICIEPSSFNIICGGTGSGKSTLLRHMKKELMPHGKIVGNVYYMNEPILSMDDRKSACEIGFVGQNVDRQIVMDKVFRELAFGLENLGCKNELIKRRIAEVSSFFGISDWLYKDVNHLSGGQKQRLNLASVMAMQPKVLVLDEPISQLDPISANEFIDMLVKVNREIGTTIIMTEHRLEEVYSYADNIFVMENGKITYYGLPKRVAKELCKDNNRMFNAMPAATKLVKRENSSELGNDVPLTIKEGRVWYQALSNEEKKIICLEEDSICIQSIDNRQEENLIDLKNAWFAYDRNSDYVLRNMSIHLNKGLITSIIGGNGSGKSTAVKAMLGIEKLFRGKLILKEKNMRICAVMQNPQALFTQISVEDELYNMTKKLDELNVKQNVKEKIHSKNEKIEICEKMIELFEIGDIRKSNPMDLSGGQMQKLALAMILILKPKVLILDEPTKGMDAFFKQKVGNILRDYVNKGNAVCIVTHDLEFAAKYSDKCLFIFDGEVVCEGTPEEVMGQNMYYTTAVSRITDGKILVNKMWVNNEKDKN